MLTASNIHKSYGSLEILKGVDLTIAKNEVTAIIGASGAGKSTLLHVLGTLDKPNKGDIWIEGVNVSKLKEQELNHFRNQKIGFIFQFHHLLPEFTALENVSMPAMIAHRPYKEIFKEATELLHSLGLMSRLHHKPSQLSGGEQQRVAIARALINKPAVLLADEPSGNLDSENARELHKLLFHLRDNFNQTCIIVTHNEEMAAMADRKLIMKDGIIIK